MLHTLRWDASPVRKQIPTKKETKQKPTKVLDQECSLRTCVLRLETTLGRSGFQDVRLRFKGWSVCPDLSKHATGTSYTHRTKGKEERWPKLQKTGKGLPNQS